MGTLALNAAKREWLTLIPSHTSSQVIVLVSAVAFGAVLRWLPPEPHHHPPPSLTQDGHTRRHARLLIHRVAARPPVYGRLSTGAP